MSASVFAPHTWGFTPKTGVLLNGGMGPSFVWKVQPLAGSPDAEKPGRFAGRHFLQRLAVLLMAASLSA
jgi:hypothetical protein